MMPESPWDRDGLLEEVGPILSFLQSLRFLDYYEGSRISLKSERTRVCGESNDQNNV